MAIRNRETLLLSSGQKLQPMTSFTMGTLTSALFTGKTVLANFCFSVEVARCDLSDLKAHIHRKG